MDSVLKELIEANRAPSTVTDALYRPVVLHGANDDVDSGTVPEEFTRANSGTIFFPASAATLSVVSSSTSDTVAGTGARYVLIEGLDANWEEVSETVALNGTTPVVTTTSFFRINFCRVVLSGSGLVNAGNITVSHGGTQLRYIAAGEGICHTLCFSVPKGHELFLTNTRQSVKKPSGAVVLEVANFTFVSITNTKYLGTRITVTDQAPEVSQDFSVGLPRIPEKSDTWYSVTYSSASNIAVAASFRGILVKLAKL